MSSHATQPRPELAEAIPLAQVHALRRVALAVAHPGGPDLFADLVRELAASLQVGFVFMAVFADDSRTRDAHPGRLPGRPHAAQLRLPARRLSLRRRGRAVLSVRARPGCSAQLGARLAVRQGAHGFLRGVSAQRQRGRAAGAGGGDGPAADRRRAMPTTPRRCSRSSPAGRRRRSSASAPTRPCARWRWPCRPRAAARSSTNWCACWPPSCTSKSPSSRATNRRSRGLAAHAGHV